MRTRYQVDECGIDANTEQMQTLGSSHTDYIIILLLFSMTVYLVCSVNIWQGKIQIVQNQVCSMNIKL